MPNEEYSNWRAELNGRAHEHDTDSNICGRWRIVGAKTKPDYPVAIWPTGTGQLLKIGRQEAVSQNSTDWHEFIGNGWTKCIAVSVVEYDAAVAHGVWPNDGKPARRQTEAEKAGFSMTGLGDNAPPAEEAIADQIASAVESAQKITAVIDADGARKANEMAERLQTLFKLGNAERDKEKRPHDDASKAVQAKWLPVITPASDERVRVLGLAKAWVKAEEDRQRAAAEAARRVRQAEIDAENERIRQENERRMAEARVAFADAVENGDSAPPPVAEQIEELAPAVTEAPKVQATSSYGRAVGLRTVTRANITDMRALTLALLDTGHPELQDMIKRLADRAAKAGIALSGMVIEKTRE